MGILLLVIGLLLFVGLVVVHEWGHFIAARRGGVDVEEFGIFFPPRLWRKQIKGGPKKRGADGKTGWDFTINALPLGGFVKLKGEHDSDTEPGSFGAAGFGTKVKIMLAGVGMNLVIAVALFTVLAWIGMPRIVDNQFTVASDTHVVQSNVLVGQVEQGSPAEKAGLQSRDQVVQIGSSAVKTSDDLRKLTKQNAGKSVPITYTRDGQTHTATVAIRTVDEVAASQKTDNPKGHLGVTPTEFSLQRSTWSAPVVAVGLTAQLTQLTFQGLWHALQGLGGILAGAVTGNGTARHNAQTEASSQVSGPVGIFVILKDGSLLGYQFMLFIIAIISLTLAIMNVLPIPALDGGRLFVMLIARALRKQISPKVEEAIYAAGFAALMLLIIVITIVDVKRFF